MSKKLCYLPNLAMSIMLISRFDQSDYELQMLD